MKYLKILTCWMLFFPILACAEEAPKATGSYEFEVELDPYYSNMGWYFGMQDQPIPYVESLSELKVYKQLMKESLVPDFFVVEMSVNPLPYLGTFVKKKKTNLDTTFRSLVAGFDEPYALSLFAGRVFHFGHTDQKKSGNKGFIGYVLSIGDQHIKDSVLIPDHWLEVEWKAKGDWKTNQQLLSWGIHVGAKFHQHPDIGDTLSIGIRRSRIDFVKREDAFLENIGFEYRYDMLQKNLKPSRHFLILKKHWPIQGWQTAISVDVGFIWDGKQRYSGALATTTAKKNGFSFVFRPNITF